MTDEKVAQRGEQREAEERREAGRQTEAGDEFTQQRPLVEELLALDHTCRRRTAAAAQDHTAAIIRLLLTT